MAKAISGITAGVVIAKKSVNIIVITSVSVCDLKE